MQLAHNVHPHCYCRLCECGVVMDRKGTVEPCDLEGCGGTYLYQCPTCKTVEIA